MAGAGHHFAMGKVGSGVLPYVVRATCFEIRASCFESGGFGYGIRAPGSCWFQVRLCTYGPLRFAKMSDLLFFILIYFGFSDIFHSFARIRIKQELKINSLPLHRIQFVDWFGRYKSTQISACRKGENR